MKYAPSSPIRNCIEPQRSVVLIAGVTFACAIAYAVFVKGPNRGAFNRWRPALGGLVSGDDIYSQHGFPTPPTMALILTPFATMPKPWGFVGWTALEVGVAIAAMIALTKQTARTFESASADQAASQRLAAKAGILAFAIAAVPMTADIAHGNVNLWVFGLVGLGVAALWANRWWAAGLAISLAATCKISPALLIVYLLWKRHFTAVGAALLGLLVWAILLPGAVLGFERNAALATAWWRTMPAPFLTEGKVDAEQVNQSLPALVHRTLTSAVAIRGMDGLPDRSIGLVELGERETRFVVAAIIAALLCGLAWIASEPWSCTCEPRRCHETALVLIAMLLVSERTWKHHYTTLFVPTLVLAWQAFGERRRLAMGARCALAAMVGCLALSSNDLMRMVGGGDAAKWVQAFGGYALGAMALAATLAGAALREPQTRLMARSDVKETMPSPLDFAWGEAN